MSRQLISGLVVALALVTGISLGPATVADVIFDLKLPAEKRNRALAIVKTPRITFPASADRYPEMRDLLDKEDYENFVAAVGRLRRSERLRGGD